MCLAIPGQIKEIGSAGDDLATVDVSGVQRRVNIGLLVDEGIKVGDWVLIHVGFAMSKVDEAEAKSTLEFLHSMGQAWQDEINVLEASAIE